jgi:hypothetical protein
LLRKLFDSHILCIQLIATVLKEMHVFSPK